MMTNANSVGIISFYKLEYCGKPRNYVKIVVSSRQISDRNTRGHDHEDLSPLDLPRVATQQVDGIE